MRRALLVSILFVTVLAAFGAPAPAAADHITFLLREFLSNPDDPEVHDRFWADDVVYTGFTGLVKTKAELAAMRAEVKRSRPADYQEKLAADEITVRFYGEAALVNFRLTVSAGWNTLEFRNSAVFIRRKGRWQVVNWQATRVL